MTEVELPIWPESLRPVLAELRPDTRQEFIETRMDSGDVKRRPRTTPARVLAGTFWLEERPWSVLEEFAYRTYRKSPFKLGEGAPAKVVAFQKLTNTGQKQENGRASYRIEMELLIIS